ncbi:enolase C-terminal domain-like protein [Chitinasiproducens palmae]|uniref:L-alanine-DL-glutamate epimerase n=1 Tax=Chitinasiproducens palmae TaxID=1770053 RepID=A0A1H2PJV7_9BURK|nr:enolase C-terminal domain-like protein [Chitinasiproducens palmae]SDV46158.1 L-alanine-DL-glutamate epimerase [Chitinasiproducens palmae]
MPNTVPIDALRVSAYRIPCDAPEADGTLTWRATTLVAVELDAGGHTGVGYSYTDSCVVGLLNDTLADAIRAQDPLAPQRAHRALLHAVRNLGGNGLAMDALSAVDCALWDLKARLLDVPLCVLFGAVRDAVPIYGSGGFTSYDDGQLAKQLADWVERDGCHAVKMKIGAEIGRDPARVAIARRAIGDAALFVDANGALTPRTALAFIETVARHDVRWFEEPVSSDDASGLRRVRDGIGARGLAVDVAAGEYAATPEAFRTLLRTEAVDVLQADATRCGGFTGFLAAAAQADAAHTDFSAHCAPALHLHVACAAPRLRHIEWFHDHVRVEAMLFDGVPVPAAGVIRPDLSRAGNGLTLRAGLACRVA